jgi:hypothetical protein
VDGKPPSAWYIVTVKEAKRRWAGYKACTNGQLILSGHQDRRGPFARPRYSGAVILNCILKYSDASVGTAFNWLLLCEFRNAYSAQVLMCLWVGKASYTAQMALGAPLQRDWHASSTYSESAQRIGRPYSICRENWLGSVGNCSASLTDAICTTMPYCHNQRQQRRRHNKLINTVKHDNVMPCHVICTTSYCHRNNRIPGTTIRTIM